MSNERARLLGLEDIQAVMADWDDTYVITRPAKYAHHKEVAWTYFGHQLTDETLDAHWGTGLENELPHFYGHPAGIEFDDLLAAYNSLRHLFPKPLQSDTQEFHRQIGQIGMARGVVSALLTPNVLYEIGQTQLAAEDFLFIHGPDITIARKPDPAVFEPGLAILAEHGIGPAQTLYVGDDLRDGIAAREAGIHFVGVATGKVALAEFIEAEFVAETSLTNIARLIIPQVDPVVN